MRVLRCLLAALLAWTLTGCNRQAATVPVIDQFGNAGRASGTTGDGKHVEVTTTYWQHGSQLTYFIVGQLPDEDPAPAALLLIRRTSPSAVQTSMMVGTQADKTFWKEQLTEPDRKPFDIAYEITHKPAGDVLKLGGQTYDLASGGFFLIDLAQNPVKPVQLKEKMVPLLPSHDPTQDQLRGAVEQLKQKQEVVRKFLEDAH